jgi:hypothetical protein
MGATGAIGVERTRRIALLAGALALLLACAGCTKAAAPQQVAAAAAFTPNANATPEAGRRLIPAELRSPTPGPRPTARPTAFPTLAAPRRTATTGPCPAPEIVLSTIMDSRPGGTAWTFLITADCALSRLELNIRLATTGGADPRCFEQEAMARERLINEWSDMACSQVGYRLNNDLIEGWWFEPSRLPAAASESRVTIVYRTTPQSPPGLPAPVGLLFTWSWDGGEPTSTRWDALPLLGRSVEPPNGQTITRLLPLPARG